MSVCDDIRPDLAAYLTGDLDEVARGRVREHLAGCNACQTELEGTKQVILLMPRGAFEHPPPEDLESHVFALVEHDREAQLVATAPVEHDPPDDLERRSMEHAGILTGSRAWWARNSQRLSPALAAATLIFAGLGMNWRSDAQHSNQEVANLESHYGPWGHTMGTIDLTNTASMTGGGEVAARLVRTQQENFRVVLYTEGLPPTPAGQHYEVWLVNDEQRVSCGSFKVEKPAHLPLPFLVGVDPMDYPELEISLEPNDGGPGLDGEVVMEARLAGVGSP